FSGTTAWTGPDGAPDDVSGFAVLVPKWTIVKATTPATRIRAENHGNSRLIRRERLRAAGGVLIVPRLDAISAEGLEDGRLAPDAPDLAERVAHLAHRHVRAGPVDDRRHQVRVVRLGRALQLRQGGLDGAGVPTRAQRLHAVD